ncbi:hypothetical protein NQ317_017608 [Molorchus minor]|uniref:Uncharacterized protein n=1 Tax=Molorchus minor TaxID=1323400 RepID=A0ABQ9J0P6_9CUCU|nr:hypothetical protein NQ317_017608 [Molorchus minor]
MSGKYIKKESLFISSCISSVVPNFPITSLKDTNKVCIVVRIYCFNASPLKHLDNLSLFLCDRLSTAQHPPWLYIEYREGPRGGQPHLDAHCAAHRGAISPSLFTSPSHHQQQPLVMANYPVSANLMIGDYAKPGNGVAMASVYRQCKDMSQRLIPVSSCEYQLLYWIKINRQDKEFIWGGPFSTGENFRGR